MKDGYGVSLPGKFADDIGADESRTTDDQYFHVDPFERSMILSSLPGRWHFCACTRFGCMASLELTPDQRERMNALDGALRVRMAGD